MPTSIVYECPFPLEEPDVEEDCTMFIEESTFDNFKEFYVAH
jgi:hypothetical protein